MKLTNDNYFSLEADKKYCSVSQLKQFIGYAGKQGCEARVMAELNGEYKREVSSATQTAFNVGSYVDCALLEPEKLEKFKEQHPEMYSSRGATKGELKADYKIAEKMIERAKRDEFFMKTLEGDHQKILTGEIEGLPFKIKMDVYKKGKYITDLKTCKSIRECYWDGVEHRRKNFLEWFDYITQGAIYREIVRQNTGEILPFFISAISKENTVDLEVIQIPNEMLDEKLEELRPLIANVKLLKEGEIEPCKCGECDYCKEQKVLTKPILMQDLFGEVEEVGTNE